MKIFKITYPLVILTIMTSCVYSLFPIYTAENLVYEPLLEGEWKNENHELIIFTPYQQQKKDPFNVKIKGQNTDNPKELALKKEWYQAKIISQEDTLTYEARLAKIGDHLFLDFYPESEDKILEKLAYNYFPVHTFMKVEIKEDIVVLTSFNLSELKDLFKSNKIRLRHELVEENVIITAQPKEIQKFLLHYSDDERVFSEPETYSRKAS